MERPTKKTKLIRIPTLQEYAMNCVLQNTILSQVQPLLWRVLLNNTSMYKDLRKAMDENVKMYDTMLRLFRENSNVVQGLPETTYCDGCDCDVYVDYADDFVGIPVTQLQNAILMDVDQWSKLKTCLRALRSNTKSLQTIFGSRFKRK